MLAKYHGLRVRLAVVVVALVALCTFSGCFFIQIEDGHPIDASSVSGAQNVPDVLARAGAPDQVVEGPNSTWFLYKYHKYQGWLGGFGLWLGKLDGATDTMVVSFNGDGTISSWATGPNSSVNTDEDIGWSFWPFGD